MAKKKEDKHKKAKHGHNAEHNEKMMISHKKHLGKKGHK